MPLPLLPWTTNYPTTQDTEWVEQPTLTGDSIPDLHDGHRFQVEHVHALRNKLQAVCLLVGDDSDLPSGSLRERVTTIETGMNLQGVYDGGGAGPQVITIDGTRLGVMIRQPEVPISTDIFGVQSYGGSSSHLLVKEDGKVCINTNTPLDSSQLTVNGTVTASTPTLTGHLTTKGYVDNLMIGLSWKALVVAASAGLNVTLSGEQTIDGVGVVDGNRVLLKDQSSAAENGIWICRTGAWERASDLPTGSHAANTVLFVDLGTANEDTSWICTTDKPNDVVGTNSLTFVSFAGVMSHNALSGLQGGTSSEYYHLTSAEYTGLHGVASPGVVFASGTGVLATDASNFKWDNTDKFLTIQRSGIEDDILSGFELINPTEATELVPEQNSPALKWSGSVWTGGSPAALDVSSYLDVSQTLLPIGTTLFYGTTFSSSLLSPNPSIASIGVGIAGMSSYVGLVFGSNAMITATGSDGTFDGFDVSMEAGGVHSGSSYETGDLSLSGGVGVFDVYGVPGTLKLFGGTSAGQGGNAYVRAGDACSAVNANGGILDLYAGGGRGSTYRGGSISLIAGGGDEGADGGDLFVEAGNTTNVSGIPGNLYLGGGYNTNPGVHGYIVFKGAGYEKIRMTAAGLLGVGTTVPSTLLHVASSTTATAIATIEQASADTDAGDLILRKSRGDLGAPTIITTGDELGTIQFAGQYHTDVGDYVVGAAIKAISEGTVGPSGTQRVPAHLSFWTGTDAAPSVLTERWRISSVGTLSTTQATSDGIHIDLSGSGSGIQIDATGSGNGIYINKAPGGSSAGYGLYVSHGQFCTGYAIYVNSASAVDGIVSLKGGSTTGNCFYASGYAAGSGFYAGMEAAASGKGVEILHAGSGTVLYGKSTGTGKLAEFYHDTTLVFEVSHTGQASMFGGTVKSNTDFLTLVNTAWASDSDGTSSSILFRHAYSATPDLADSGRIQVGTETDWTATAGTRDSYLALHTSLDGVVAERWRVSSGGTLSTTQATNINSVQVTHTGVGSNHAISVTRNPGGSSSGSGVYVSVQGSSTGYGVQVSNDLATNCFQAEKAPGSWKAGAGYYVAFNGYTSGAAFQAAANGTGHGIYIDKAPTGTCGGHGGFFTLNSFCSSDGLHVDHAGSGVGIQLDHTGSGRGLYLSHTQNVEGFYLSHTGVGNSSHAALINKSPASGPNGGHGVYLTMGANCNGRGVYVDNNGAGDAIYVENASNSGRVLYGTSAADASMIYLNHTGVGDNSDLVFLFKNPGGTSAGRGIYLYMNSSCTEQAIYVNSSAAAPSVQISHEGVSNSSALTVSYNPASSSAGYAGYFSTNTNAATAACVFIFGNSNTADAHGLHVSMGTNTYGGDGIYLSHKGGNSAWGVNVDINPDSTRSCSGLNVSLNSNVFVGTGLQVVTSATSGHTAYFQNTTKSSLVRAGCTSDNGGYALAVSQFAEASEVCPVCAISRTGAVGQDCMSPVLKVESNKSGASGYENSLIHVYHSSSPNDSYSPGITIEQGVGCLGASLQIKNYAPGIVMTHTPGAMTANADSISITRTAATTKTGRALYIAMGVEDEREAIKIVRQSGGAATVYGCCLYAENGSPNNTAPAISIYQNLSSSGGAYGLKTVMNANCTGSGVQIEHAGSGTAIYGKSTGSGKLVEFYHETTEVFEISHTGQLSFIETGGSTLLAVGAISDGQYLIRSGSTVVGATLSSSSWTHNSLSGLQGGTTGEYYHLTSAEYTGLHGLTSPGVAFVTATGVLGTDATNFRWDNTDKRLGIGVTPTATLHAVQPVVTTGSPVAFKLTGGAHTTLTVAETNDVYLNLNRTVTFTTGGGTIANQRAVRIEAPTYAAGAACTLTDAATVAVSGAPVKSTNVTVTRTHALLIEAGAVGSAANSYGLTVNAQTGATTANYCAAFLGGYVGVGLNNPSYTLDVYAVSSATINRLAYYYLSAGYTGTNATYAIFAQNNTAGTGTNLVNSTGNFAIEARMTQNTAGDNCAIHGQVNNGTKNIAVLGDARGTVNSGTHIGVMGIARNTGTSPTHIGGYFGLNDSQPTYASAALMCDNAAETSNIFVARDGGTAVFTIADAGYISHTATSSASLLNGIYTILAAGYTSTSATRAVFGTNSAAGTGTAALDSVTCNSGVFGYADATTVGDNVGVYGEGRNGTRSYGVVGRSIILKNSGTNIGVAGIAANAGTTPTIIGGFFGLMSTTPTFASAALMCDNGGTTDSIFVARDNGTATFTIADGGGITTVNDGTNHALSMTGGTLATGKYAMNVTATLNNSGAAHEYGTRFQITSAGSSASYIQIGVQVNLNSGYTGTNCSAALRGINGTLGTGTDILSNSYGNVGVAGTSSGVAAAHNCGVFGIASGGNLSVAVLGRAWDAKNSATNIGVLGIGLNTGTTPVQLGGYFGLHSSAPTYASAALMCDNGSTTSDIFVARDGGTAIFTIADGGNITSSVNSASAELSLTQAGTGNAITVSKTTTGAGYGIGVTMGANCSAAAIDISQGGTGNGMTITKTAAGGNVLTVTGGTLSATGRLISGTCTHNATVSADPRGIDLTVTTAGTSAYYPRGMFLTLAAGYTGSKGTMGLTVANSVAGTATSVYIGDANIAVYAYSDATTTGHNAGVTGGASGGVANYGLFGSALLAKNSGTNVGVMALGRNTGTSPTQVGGYFGLNNGMPTLASAALMCDNSDQTSNIFVARDNGTATFTIADGGSITQASGNYTISAGTLNVTQTAAANGIYINHSGNDGGIFVSHSGVGSNARCITVTRSPGSSSAGHGIYVSMGANCTDNAIEVGINSGSGYSIHVAAGSVKFDSTFLLPGIADNAGTYAVKWTTSTGNITYTSSDARIKENIRDYNRGLDVILGLTPRAFTYRGGRFQDGRVQLLSEAESSECVGLVAQEVYPVMPEVVFKPADESKAFWNVNYEQIVPALINAVKELHAEADVLRGRIKELESRLAA